ncbi:MAG TPA: hypothetical protein VMZ26_04650, partial [Pyrinomonadaceae bacterium]|nr:hypothetical protein [Pyrinomonadaceae bacterium]
MKRFIFAVVLCASLLCALSSLLFPSATAAENPLLALLNLPAPPPPNPQVSFATTVHPENFFSKDNPPPDDAPIESLMEYWRVQAQIYGDVQFKIYPSEKVLERLKGEIVKDPAKLVQFLNILPPDETSGKFVKEIYDKSASGDEEARALRQSLKTWLKFHTPLFSAELANEAARVSDVDDYVTNHRALVALARVDWDRASSIANRLYNNPGQKASRTAALWALYVHAIESSPGDTERYRDELKEIVADKSLGPGVRDLALDALSLEKEWAGRDEWYLSMMEDETLTDLGRFTGLTTLISNSPAEKYIERMIGLLDSENIAVRSAAAQNLMDRLETRRTSIVKALLPWLGNPKWLKQTQRSARHRLVQALAQEKMPESVPGLIAALDEKEIHEVFSGYAANAANTARRIAVPMNTNAYAANSAGYSNTMASSTEVSYPLRSPAISALAFQKDPRAAPALRRILNGGVGPYENSQLVMAIYECGGFSLTEQLTAVENVARAYESVEADVNVLGSANYVANVSRGSDVIRMAPSLTIYEKDGTPTTDITRILGIHLANRSDAGDELARAVIDRLGSVERSDPALAAGLRKILMGWQGAAINGMLLRDLKMNKVNADAIVRLLSMRKELREKQLPEVSDLRTGSPIAVGISSCLLEDPNDLETLLESSGDETKTAVLACARLIRTPLPVQKVAKNLQSKDKLVALAAERYLESEDSPEARRIVLSLHAGEAKILGATYAFYTSDAGEPMSSPFLLPLFATVSAYHAQPRLYDGGTESRPTETETGLRDEVKLNPDLLGIYSWESNSIRIYKDQAVVRWEDDPARYRERVLTKDEFDNFKGLLAHYKADELPPFLACSGGERCESKTLVMLGRNGGRRLFVKAKSMPPLFAELDRLFAEMRQPPSAIKYRAGKDVPGLELLFADDRLDAKAVWKSGADFRLLTADKVRRAEIDAEIETFSDNLVDDSDEPTLDYVENPRVSKERSKREYENFVWNSFVNGALGAVTTQPSQVEFIPVKDDLGVAPDEGRWKARAGAVEIRADDKGLYKVAAGKLTKLQSGYYSSPLITPNGRWAIATRYDDNDGVQLVRVNLLTNKQFVVPPQENPVYQPVAFVPSINRVLVGRERAEYDEYDDEESTTAEDGGGYSLLDPETGSLIRARGEIRPLIQQTFRPLQPATAAFEFWAAIPKENETVIGLYNTRTFT